MGGIVLYNHETGVIRNCVNKANISGSEQSILGGICAVNEGTIENCINEGEITMYKAAGGLDSNVSAIGGIVGTNGSWKIREAKINNCKNYGKLSVGGGGGLQAAGGICGRGFGYILNSCNLGDIQYDKKEAIAGGICGCTYGENYKDYDASTPGKLYIYNCYNSNKIIGTYVYFGEILGMIKSGSVYIKNSYGLGDNPLISYFSGYEDEGQQIMSIKNCYVLSSKYATKIEDSKTPVRVLTFDNCYNLESENSTTSITGIIYVTDNYMKTNYFCNSLNNNELSDDGKPIFKMIKEQDYPALYWQEGTPK